MPAAMPCQTPVNSGRETHRNIGNGKTKYAWVVDADESTRPRPEGAGHKPHQDHNTAKGMNSMNHYSLAHKFIPIPQTFKKFQMRRLRWQKNEKLEKDSGVGPDKSQKQIRGDR